MEVYFIIKRIFEIVISSLALFLLTPLVLSIIIILKFSTNTSPILKQKRMGKKGEEIFVYKFRTLENNTNIPSRIGKFLRTTFLDEIPQFFNILKGEMSLVGPRPELFHIASEYNEEQKKRLNVRPGLTGVWQISPFTEEPIHEHLECDLYYINNRSLWLDLFIFAETIKLFFNKILSYVGFKK